MAKKEETLKSIKVMEPKGMVITEIDKLNITDETGNKREADVLLHFEMGDPKKEYIIYTFNEKDDKDMVIIYTSIVETNGEKVSLVGIEDQEEWAKIKDVIREAIKASKE
ncbi:MAG: DUF1292 domain-containing protein [Firmicutes bacterium]|nr:DUF1292 domain-containing protein [Bacillota bacterium]